MSKSQIVGFLSVVLAFSVQAFFPRTNSRQLSRALAKESRLYASQEKGVFGSKLMADISEDELTELFKEFNISNFNLNNDPELAKWGPTKEFFEKFGFQNNTERYKRKTMNVKMDFYSAYTRPILPQYKTFIADLMSMTFVQSIDSRYKYDALHAFGICTQYYTIMKGYALQDEIDVIFNEMMKAVGFDPVKLRDDAKRMLSVIKSLNATEDEVLNLQEGELAEIFNGVRSNRFFKYTDAWGVGLGRLIELIGKEPNQESFEKWAASLKWIFPTRVSQTWGEFCSDQLKMQGIEAMQKQLMIREKKRAAARLEAKAAGFEDKKSALQQLNLDIEERRMQIIEEQKLLKKKYEPEEYEKILAESSTA